ncbi:hypothetical protein ACFLU1_03835 [Chloroflexota bacterium]
MSKFIDKLNRLSRGETQAIGFTARASASPKAKIQLVAGLAAESAGSLTGHVAGADAGLLSISKPGAEAEALQKIAQALPDIPWGCWLQGSDKGEIKQLTRAGCDFAVFPAADTPLTIIENEKTGRILEIEPSLNEGLLRAINQLDIDAVFIAGKEQESKALTWQHLMLFRRFADLLTRPLLVTVPSQVTAGELKSLWEAGVAGVVVEVTEKQPEDRLKKLRREIDKLEFPSLRRHNRAEALLPRISGESSTATAEDEEEEEEED